MKYPAFEKWEVLLASRSPRRRQLLEQLGISYRLVENKADESFPKHLKKEAIALYLAEKKAESVREGIDKNQVLLTCDTIVCLGDEVLNKPADEKEAFEMLSALSGTVHQVICGVCLKTVTAKTVFYDVTDVYFKKLSKAEIDFYIENYKPFDKAGAYGIQEWIGLIGVQKIVGSYFNVVGLPMHKVFEHLQAL